MMRAFGSVGLVLAIIHASALTQAARALRLPPAPPSTTRSDYESELDKQSWEVYSGNGLSARMPNVTAAAKVGAGTAGSASFGDQAASARIARFISASEARHFDNSSRDERAEANVSSRLFGAESDASSYCPQHIPVDDPYWQETENYDQTHHGYIKCDVIGGCKKSITNAQRVKSIRRALKGTATLLATLGIKSMLYGGSALGYHRCGDVIPWDVDCDVLVDRADIATIHKAVYGVPIHWNKLEVGGWTSGDLASFGAKGIRLNKKTPCTPFEVVDTQTGFMCDVFPADRSQGASAALFTPWWAGTTPCPGRFPECAAAGGSNNCYMFPKKSIEPTRPCTIHGAQFECPVNLENYLAISYGEGFRRPNQQIAAGNITEAETAQSVADQSRW